MTDGIKTVFTDEAALFQLFRNTVERWYKGERPVRRMPKDHTKIMAHAPEMSQMLGDRWRTGQRSQALIQVVLQKAFFKENFQ
ncbi:22450_t:CDS:2 [Rhizophagus irregularis]|nr:22450_t:CDS:2 [Rhizophagus irregularis]